jgi:glycosyltransferase involved in cell wall biosynthesis
MKVSFVIPFHNEEKNLPKMIDRVSGYIKKTKINAEIVAVDDNSQDNTKKILNNLSKKNRLIHPIFRKNNNIESGNTMGMALIAGTRKSIGKIIIWTMGDLADDIDTYTKIINKLRSKDIHMVFGSRYMPGGSRGNLDALKAFLSSWGTRLAKLMFGVPVHDITNAFRGFKKEVFENISLESKGFSISPEFAIKAHLNGYKLAEVPTVYTNRIEGVSSFKLYKMTASYLRIYLKLFIKYYIFGKK